MIKRICSVSLALMLLMTAIVPLAAAADNGWLMFVYTENRGSLNVRSSMSTGNNVVGKLDFGTAVQVYSFFGSWALINYKNTNAYVMTRYLTYTQPTTPVTPTPAPASDTSLNDINKEFKTALEYWAKWYQEGILSPDFVNMSFDDMNEDVVNGRAAFQQKSSPPAPRARSCM